MRKPTLQVAVCSMWTDEIKTRVICERKKNCEIQTSQKPDATGKYFLKLWKVYITKIKIYMELNFPNLCDCSLGNVVVHAFLFPSFL
jgi:hypothetical protein